ncbi:MAG: hypothetical protein JJT89_02630 [Nitriliruptoraceae bacterium]|nr:hypothetical protein [Nitriliruptoraceae bacterium]
MCSLENLRIVREYVLMRCSDGDILLWSVIDDLARDGCPEHRIVEVLSELETDGLIELIDDTNAQFRPSEPSPEELQDVVASLTVGGGLDIVGNWWLRPTELGIVTANDLLERDIVRTCMLRSVRDRPMSLGDLLTVCSGEIPNDGMTALRQLLDDQLLAAADVAFDDLPSSSTEPGAWLDASARLTAQGQRWLEVFGVGSEPDLD